MPEAKTSLLSRRGEHPRVHAETYVAPSAVIAGDVTIDAGCAVLDGAVVVAESAPVHIGKECVIMEHAVVRGAGKHATQLAGRVLVGPHAHVTGAIIGEDCMVATGACVFNGASVGSGSLVAIGAIVHVGTRLPEGSRVPIHHIAVGDPVEIFSPDRAPDAHRKIAEIGFTRSVFDFDTSAMSFKESMAWVCQTYSKALRRHGH